jgi:uncharacterized membrane protein YkvA (DUF1232 family)
MVDERMDALAASTLGSVGWTSSGARASFGAGHTLVLMRWVLVSVAGVLVAWFVLLLVVYVMRPDHGSLRDGARILPDTLRLVCGLATDKAVPRSARWLLWGLLAYLALPIDLIPDFLPVIGWADDLIIASLVLRYLIKRAGAETVRVHWPGDAEGLSTLGVLLRIPLGESN